MAGRRKRGFRQSDLLRAALVATGAAIAVTSCERQLDSLACPCVSGYECCALDNLCYRAGQSCGDGSSGASGESSAAGASGASTTKGTGGTLGTDGAGAPGQTDGGGAANEHGGGNGGNEWEGRAGATNASVPASAFPRYCSSSGWCGAKNTFQVAWGTPELGIWVAANDRVQYATNSLSRWDGERWTNFDRERDSWGRMLAVGGSGRDDVWFAGEDGGFAWFAHWDGASFERMSYNEAVEIRGIWGSAPTDVWAVGLQGYTLHFDGDHWSAEMSPSFANDLNAIWGSGPDDVIVVGSYGVVARWNGASWTIEREGLGPDLTSVWGSAPNDVWAVGPESPVLHFDGEAWSERDIELPELEDVGFVQVTGTSARDVWLAEHGGQLVHFDGRDFRVLATSATSIETMAPAREGEAWAFGALAFSASCERSGCVESTPLTDEDLLATWGRSREDVWAVGANGGIVHFDGAGWQRVESPTTAPLRAIHGAGGRIWAVGDAVLRHENGEWASEDGLHTPPLHAVFAFAENDVWVAGEDATLRHFDGDAWTSFDPAGSVGTLTGLWGSAPDDVWAVGVGDTNLHFDGSSWTPVNAPASIEFDQQVIAGTARDNVFIFGWYRELGVPSFGQGRWDGRSWTFDGGDYGLALTTFGKAAAWAVGPRDVWMVNGSDLGTTELYRLGASFRSDFGGTDLALHGVWGLSAHESWAVGAEGTLLEKVFSLPQP